MCRRDDITILDSLERDIMDTWLGSKSLLQIDSQLCKHIYLNTNTMEEELDNKSSSASTASNDTNQNNYKSLYIRVMSFLLYGMGCMIESGGRSSSSNTSSFVNLARVLCDSTFRSIGQVVFANNPLSGFIITIGMGHILRKSISC